MVDGEVVALCLAEEFGGENSLKFDTVIEDFDDNIVLNGSKSGVIGAKEADYFLVFSSTLVKERDEKLYKLWLKCTKYKYGANQKPLNPLEE